MLAARDDHEGGAHAQPTLHDLVDAGAAGQPVDVLVGDLDDVRQGDEAFEGSERRRGLAHDRGARVRVEAHERVLAAAGQRV